MNSEMKENREKYFYACLLAGCFFIYFMWANVLPFDAGPDEHMRYQIPEFIYKYGYLPHGGDERIREATWGISYGFTPILSYIISALFMKITGFFTTSFKALVLAARMVSVLSSTGTVYFCIKIGKKLFNGVFRYVFVICVALLPEFVFISSYVNNDAFGIFTVSWVVYAMIVANEKKWDFKSSVFLGIAIGVCTLSYYNCYGIIVTAVIFALLSVITNDEIENKFKFIVTRVLWVGVSAFIIAGWWFIRNAVIYNGDFLGLNTSKKYGEKYAAEAFKPSNRGTPNNLGMPLKVMLFDLKWIDSSVLSFVGVFDAMSVGMEEWNYRLIFVIIIIGLLGSFIPKIISGVDKKNNLTLLISCWIMCIITVCLSIYYSYFNDYQPQGRYCLPMIVTLSILVAYGWDSLTNRYHKIVRDVLAFSIIASYCAVLIYATCNIIIPKYIH